MNRAQCGVRRAYLVLLICLATSPVTLAAQAGPSARRPLAIEDYYRVRTVGNPRISPDGRWVLYTVTVRLEENQANAAETWYVATDGSSAPQHLWHDGTDVSNASWADARIRYRVGNRSYLLNPARPTDPRVEDNAPAASEGVRSPNGELLAQLVRETIRPTARTFASDFEKRHEERFRGAQFDWMTYKRDGSPAPVRDPRDLVTNPPVEIFIANADGTSTRRLTRLGLQPSNLQWTRSGNALLFAADSIYRDELTYDRTDLWLITLEGAVRRLTHDAFVYSSPTLSPDRRQLAFIRSIGTDSIIQAKLNHGGARDLFVMPAPDAGASNEWKPINLTAEWDLDPAAPIWAPDNRTIYFAAGIGGETQLFKVDTRGGPVVQVTQGPRRLAGITFDRAMRTIAYTVGEYERPADIFVANIDGTGERRLTHEGDALLEQVALSRADRLEFRSRDGTRIEGWITLPYNFRRDGGPYPLIVANHGGPHSADGYGFDFKNQYFAANGYFVLEVNFRSSTGYGDAFKWGTWGAWGTKDGEDVMAGVDHAIANYPIDRRRVGTTGHSYGGFMTNWLITQYPDRFAAAVSGAGISNWISDYGLADIARTKETEFFGKPWEAQARDIMIKQSPLFYADRVRTPTLFVHGEIDYRVPFAEAEQFYFALKKNGVPTKVIMYEGQSHGISGHWNNVHRMLNELRWWEQYLKPPKM